MFTDTWIAVFFKYSGINDDELVGKILHILWVSMGLKTETFNSKYVCTNIYVYIYIHM